MASFRSVKSTPYFLAQGLNSPMLASVISILDRAAPCFLSCFRLCWPWCSLVLPLFWVSRNLRAAACSTWIVSLADLMEKAIVFWVTSSCNRYPSFRRSAAGRLRWHRQPPQETEKGQPLAPVVPD